MVAVIKSFPVNESYQPKTLELINSEPISPPVVLTSKKCVKIATICLSAMSPVVVGALAYEGILEDLSVESAICMMSGGATVVLFYAFGGFVYYQMLYVTIKEVDWDLGTHEQYIRAGRVQKARELNSKDSIDQVMIQLEQELLDSNVQAITTAETVTHCQIVRERSLKAAFNQIHRQNPDILIIHSEKDMDPTWWNKYFFSGGDVGIKRYRYDKDPTLFTDDLTLLLTKRWILPGLDSDSMANPSAHRAILTVTHYFNDPLYDSYWTYLY